MPCAFRTGKYGKNVWTGKSRERESYGDSKRWVRHEKGEGEMERNDTHANTFYRHLSHACMCTRMKMCGWAQTNSATAKCACHR